MQNINKLRPRKSEGAKRKELSQINLFTSIYFADKLSWHLVNQERFNADEKSTETVTITVS